MSSTNDPREEQMDLLLGAYALDAIDANDRARLDAYISHSSAARDEFDQLRETAAMLALAPAPGERAPAELWARIAEQVAEPQAPPRAEEANVVPLAAKGRPLTWRMVAPAAAAAAIIVVLLAVQVVHLRGEVDQNNLTGPAAAAAAFKHATGVPGAQLASFTEAGTSGGTQTVARIVVLPDGTGYLVTQGLSPLPSTQTYQLWALVGSGPKPTAISAGVLGAAPDAVAFKVSGPVVGFALTQEHAGGVASSQNHPVAVANLS
ncbi:MAG: hypothetical protein JWL83_4324 [Actinomycetia bacterium]|nr:hypothetical protein [Actinomycetes bacterium]